MARYDSSTRRLSPAAWHQPSGNSRKIQDYRPGLFIFLSLVAISGLAFVTREDNSFVYPLSRQLYIVPIIATGWFYGWTVTVLLSLAVTCLFVPREVGLVYSTGLSQASIELFAGLVSYNLYAALTVLVVRFWRRHRRLVDAVERLGKVIETSRDLPRSLSLVVEQSQWLCDADGGEIFLSEEPGDSSSSLVGVSVIPEEGKTDGESAPSQTLLEWLTRRNELTTLSDLSIDPRFDAPPEVARSRTALLAVPLWRNHKRIGALVVWKYGGRRFSQMEIDLLSILVDESQMVIETAGAYSKAGEALSKRTRELSMLLDASAAFSSTRDLDRFVQTLCQKMTEVVESTSCQIFLLEEGSTSLTLRASYAVRSPPSQPEVGHTFQIDSLPWHQQAVLQKEPIVLLRDDPETQIGAPEFSILFGQGGHSALLIPLVVGDHCLGVATVTEMRSWERTPFDGEKIDLCRTFTRQAALAIEDIRAFESEAELLRIQSDLVSLVSHELRAPLTNISTTVQLLVEADLDQPTRLDMLQTLNQETVRLTRLVNQVLGAARAVNGRLELALEPLALMPLLEHAVSVHQSRYQDRHFQVETESGSNLFALGDRVSVETILQNLLQNAVNYSPAGSTITVRAEERGANILIGVSDQGDGIPSDDLETIFQRFRRLPDGAVQVSGFGLGLYIVRMLVEAQGGVICADSEPGQGSSFIFTLKKLEMYNGQEDSDH